MKNKDVIKVPICHILQGKNTLKCKKQTMPCHQTCSFKPKRLELSEISMMAHDRPC